jgi:CheY-like chemotaxis protein
LGSDKERRQKSLEGWKVLVVDDEPDQLTFIATVLEDNGAVTVQARDGFEAVELARKERPDLITLDLDMPGKNGADVFAELRNDPEARQIPICIVSGRPEMRALIYEQPALTKPEGYLDKPVSEEILVRGVRKIMEVLQRRRARIAKD